MKKILVLLFTFQLSVNLCADTTYIHAVIYHGSRPIAPGETHWLGGMLGGHVMVEIDSFIYGFNFSGGRVHVFPNNRKSSGVFEKERVENWSFNSGMKTTRVSIPVTTQKKQELKAIYDSCHLKPPHDYAFFGMRCASTCYLMLSKAGVFPESGRAVSIIKAFHPKALRRKLIKVAAEKKYTVSVTPGRAGRKWEGDKKPPRPKT